MNQKQVLLQLDDIKNDTAGYSSIASAQLERLTKLISTLPTPIQNKFNAKLASLNIGLGKDIFRKALEQLQVNEDMKLDFNVLVRNANIIAQFKNKGSWLDLYLDKDLNIVEESTAYALNDYVGKLIKSK